MEEDIFDRTVIVNRAKLDNGEVVIFDVQCSEPKGRHPYEIYSETIYEYLGEGVYWSSNGVMQSGTQRGMFFKKRNK